MKDRSEIGIVAATTRYEAWLAERIPLVKPDLELKHHAMSAGIFPFLRATFYRWAARWRALVGDVAAAPTVLAVGDLHVENFGTWRDAEGRLVWGVNDFDEAWPLPYTNDLVRLATSALVAREAMALAPLAEKIHYDPILRRGVRCPDPCVRVDGAWLVRRLAPDCSRVKLNELPRKRDEARLLSAMGWETANVHLGTPGSRAIRADLKRRDKHWLYDSARRLADAVDDHWPAWPQSSPGP